MAAAVVAPGRHGLSKAAGDRFSAGDMSGCAQAACSIGSQDWMKAAWLAQAAEVLWPILRGVYASADCPAAEVAEFERQISHPRAWPLLEARVHERGLQPWLLTGAARAQEVQGQLQRYQLQADSFGLRQR